MAAERPAADGTWGGPNLVGPGRTQISQYIRTMLQDRSGRIWFGTQDDGVCRRDGKALTCFSESEGLAGRADRDILEDRNGILWFATSGGVSHYDGKSLSRFPLPPASAIDLSLGTQGPSLIWSLLQDRSGRIWFGTNGGGAYRFDGKTLRCPRAASGVERERSRTAGLREMLRPA